MHIRCTLKHIETHYNQGNFYVVVATITTMCFNVFQCAKKHIENTLRHSTLNAHCKPMCFERIAKSASNTLRNTLSLVHIAEHIEKFQCAQCAEQPNVLETH